MSIQVSERLPAADIQAMLAEFWARVDRVIEAPAAEFFVDDGEMVLGFAETRGAAAIAEYFTTRREREREQGRVTRHLLTNIWVESGDRDSCVARSLVVVHAAIGATPLPSAPPSVIADFSYRLARSSSVWKIASMRSRPVFVGAGSLAPVAGPGTSS